MYGKPKYGAIQSVLFLYPGQYYDVETGLAYNRFRYYNPANGLYLSKDPIGLDGGFGLYSYVKDSNTWIDLWGLQDIVTLNNRGLAALAEGGKMPSDAIFVPYDKVPSHLKSDFGLKGPSGEVVPSKTVAVTRNKDGSGHIRNYK